MSNSYAPNINENMRIIAKFALSGCPEVNGWILSADLGVSHQYRHLIIALSPYNFE